MGPPSSPSEPPLNTDCSWPQRSPVSVRSSACALFAGAVSAMLLRRASLGWGASEAELAMVLPGDDLLAQAHLSATRAITIKAAPEAIWPWIAQLGQGRGGFYSYDFLENVVGCDIHSADRIVEEWQNVTVGEQINLAPGVGLSVAIVDSGNALVLRGAIPTTSTHRSPYDFTWAFVLLPEAGVRTRLLVRERYTYAHRWVAAIVEPVELVSLLMSRRMMHGIRQRAEKRPPSNDYV
ncbi:MAG: hypothetical protein JWM76_1354 [Pseudonocardiales bacterium]|nr:hypothetical protein [Pseudonocardiales bacterium]